MEGGMGKKGSHFRLIVHYLLFQEALKQLLATVSDFILNAGLAGADIPDIHGEIC